MIDFDVLLKMIVPLAFLAIWALTALFNRDAKPLPGRVQTQPNPYGPRPTPAPRTPPAAQSTPAIRWSPSVNPSAATRPGGDDDIVILESTRTNKPNQGKGVAPGRRSRSKPAPVPAKPAPASGPRLGSSGINQTVNQQITTSLAIQPLAVEHSTIPVQSVAAGRNNPNDITDESSRLRLSSIAALLSDRARLREAILISELLQPPLALRNRGRRR